MVMVFELPPDVDEKSLPCRLRPDAFYPDIENKASTHEAKRLCGHCAVRAECLTSALERDEKFGVWGGMSARERRKLKKTAA